MFFSQGHGAIYGEQIFSIINIILVLYIGQYKYE